MTCTRCGLFNRVYGLILCEACYAVAVADLFQSFLDPNAPNPVCAICGKPETPEKDIDSGLVSPDEATFLALVEGDRELKCIKCITEDEDDDADWWKHTQ